MNPQAIIELLDHALLELTNLNENLTILAEQKALTEGRYRRELRKEILLLRQEKSTSYSNR
ncbi:hypothetical protein [Clostridium perfringens]|uniref:hypothetical protein n=1 Tax=Clostridium perfringens TaxID=1502 RepID=UPI0024BCD9DC|nr:hypothetical protein [Clostridium perfringens]